jgi:hypothetical protein
MVVGRAEVEGQAFWCRLERLAEYGMKQLFVSEPDGYSICFESPTDAWAG